ncbi:MAG: hypothetical protein EOO39_36570 [Cytophagaceae bacterium]|nr:MAG: hypothetical protein EOO39_36570 [Cytophagaceae bacterium]
MTVQVINAVPEFERDLLIERMNNSIERARAKGKKFGQPSALSAKQKGDVLRLLAEGMPVAQIARRPVSLPSSRWIDVWSAQILTAA